MVAPRHPFDCHTLDEFRGALTYNPDTGVFRWKIKSGKTGVGQIAGHLDAKGYRMIRFDRKLYLAHRIAWLLQTGRWPADQIDHIDRNKDNNRWVNLREANLSQQRGNLPLQPNNTTGFRGVCLHKDGPKWQAQIGAGKSGKKVYLGRFAEKQDAVAAYESAAIAHYGKFYR